MNHLKDVCILIQDASRLHVKRYLHTVAFTVPSALLWSLLLYLNTHTELHVAICTALFLLALASTLLSTFWITNLLLAKDPAAGMWFVANRNIMHALKISAVLIALLLVLSFIVSMTYAGYLASANLFHQFTPIGLDLEIQIALLFLALNLALIYLSARLLFIPILVLKEERSLLESIRTSWALTSTCVWKSLMIVIFLVLFYFYVLGVLELIMIPAIYGVGLHFLLFYAFDLALIVAFYNEVTHFED